MQGIGAQRKRRGLFPILLLASSHLHKSATCAPHARHDHRNMAMTREVVGNCGETFFDQLLSAILVFIQSTGLSVHQIYCHSTAHTFNYPQQFTISLSFSRLSQTLRRLSDHAKVLQTLQVAAEERPEGTWTDDMHVQPRVHPEERSRRGRLHGRVGGEIIL